MKLFCLLLIVSVGFSANLSASEITTFTYMAPTKKKDTRARYGSALLSLALEKTVTSHGPYRIKLSPKMNKKRALATLEANSLENFFVKHSISVDASKKMGYVNFPVDLGIVGYRVFFVSPKAAAAFSQVTSLEQLKKFSITQGLGWLDTDILRHNGFNVIEGTSYDGLFKMLSRSRVDLLPRGANELFYEYTIRSKDMPLLTDTSIVLYYPLPRFFYTNKQNVAAIARIQAGLDSAYKDGSLHRLWKKHYSESVGFIDFSSAKIIKIENPFLKGLDDSYQQYVIQPNQLIDK